MNLIEKIRSYVESRKKTAETFRERDICIDILDEIDIILEKSEKPINPVCEGEEEEYEQIKQKVCSDCPSHKDDDCGYVTRKLQRQCNYLSDVMYGYELGRQSKPKVSEDVEEAAENYAYGESDDKYQGFVDGAFWQKEQDEEIINAIGDIPGDIEKAYNNGRKDMKEQMMKDYPKWHKVQRGSCFDKHTNFILSAREGHFYCSSIEVPRDGYILLVDELERLPKED